MPYTYVPPKDCSSLVGKPKRSRYGSPYIKDMLFGYYAFLDDSAPDDVLIILQSLTFEKGETIKNYVDRFWSLHSQ